MSLTENVITVVDLIELAVIQEKIEPNAEDELSEIALALIAAQEYDDYDTIM